MAGGTFTTEDKRRPGVYIRFRAGQQADSAAGERGTVALCKALSWGPVGQVQTVLPGEDWTAATGYPANAPETLFLREIFKGTNRTEGPRRVLLYRPAATGGAPASATLPAEEGAAALTVTAACPGVRGNDLSVTIAADPDGSGAFTLSTLLAGTVLDTQTLTGPADFVPNGWITLSPEGTLAATSGLALTGGLDGTVADGTAQAAFLAALEPLEFDIVLYDGTDATAQKAIAAFARRMAEENGRYCQAVVANMEKPDSQYVINVVSGVTLADGAALTAGQAAWWVAGAEAGASYNESLTYAQYPGAVAVSPVRTNTQVIQQLDAGALVLEAEDGRVRIEQDINTLATYTPGAGEGFRHNRTIRLCAAVARACYVHFRDNFVGVVHNNEAGRDQFKAWLVGYLLELEAAQAIQKFQPDNVEVLPGADAESVVINAAIQRVGSVEKIYLTVTVC